jgi:hypothetical protein
MFSTVKFGIGVTIRATENTRCRQGLLTLNQQMDITFSK